MYKSKQNREETIKLGCWNAPMSIRCSRSSAVLLFAWPYWVCTKDSKECHTGKCGGRPNTKSQSPSWMFYLQGKLQKHQAFEAEVQANSGAIVKLDETGNQMINESHFASETIRVST